MNSNNEVHSDEDMQKRDIDLKFSLIKQCHPNIEIPSEESLTQAEQKYQQILQTLVNTSANNFYQQAREIYNNFAPSIDTATIKNWSADELFSNGIDETLKMTQDDFEQYLVTKHPEVMIGQIFGVDFVKILYSLMGNTMHKLKQDNHQYISEIPDTSKYDEELRILCKAIFISIFDLSDDEIVNHQYTKAFFEQYEPLKQVSSSACTII